MSDSGNQLLKYALPPGSTLGPGQYLVVDESDFNPTPANPGPNDFALSGTQGDDVWLVVPAAGGGVSMFVDDVHFGASAAGESFGRTPNGTGRLVPQIAAYTGGVERRPSGWACRAISEIQYAPGGSVAGRFGRSIRPSPRDDLEYIELHNASSATIDLNGWNLTGGIEFRFGAGATLAAGGSLLVISV